MKIIRILFYSGNWIVFNEGRQRVSFLSCLGGIQLPTFAGQKFGFNTAAIYIASYWYSSAKVEWREKAYTDGSCKRITRLGVLGLLYLGKNGWHDNHAFAVGCSMISSLKVKSTTRWIRQEDPHFHSNNLQFICVPLIKWCISNELVGNCALFNCWISNK